jgi:hypothetical protein
MRLFLNTHTFQTEKRTCSSLEGPFIHVHRSNVTSEFQIHATLHFIQSKILDPISRVMVFA